MYQNGADPTLVRAKTNIARKQKVNGNKIFHDFPPEPMYQFHGRAFEILKLERAFRKHIGALVAGMGGMGKTALVREAAAWWLRTGRFEAAVFISFEQRTGAERVVQTLGQALAGPDFASLPADVQRRRVIELFHKTRALVVFDNFESTLPAFQNGGTPRLRRCRTRFIA